MRTICLARGEKYLLEMLLEGQVTVQIDDVLLDIKPGDSYTVCSGQVHWLRNDQHTPRSCSPSSAPAPERRWSGRLGPAGDLAARQRGAEPDLLAADPQVPRRRHQPDGRRRSMRPIDLCAWSVSRKRSPEVLSCPGADRLPPDNPQSATRMALLTDR
jgi:hypothetical protein